MEKIALDLGCGQRKIEIDGYKIVRVDIREEVHPDLVADVRQLPYEPESIDLIYASHLLEHFGRNELLGVMKHWRSILKTSGILYLVVPDLTIAAIEVLSGRTHPATWDILYGAQSHCIDPDTPVLTSDLRWIKAKDVSTGDKLVGFDENSPGTSRRRLREATVISKNKREAEIYEITTEDGRITRTSSNHRWLTYNGYWIQSERLNNTKYKVPHSVLKLTEPVESWKIDNDYKIGYLSGAYSGNGYGNCDVKRGTSCLIKVTDIDFIQRIETYITDMIVTRKVVALETRRRPPQHKQQYGLNLYGDDAIKLMQIVHNPIDNDSYKRGFIAGFFDAEGGVPPGHKQRGGAASHIVISNSDKYLIELLYGWLSGYGFSIVQKNRNKLIRKPMYYLRINGGRQEVMRFMSLFGPAISRKKLRTWVGLSPAAEKVMVTKNRYIGKGEVISIGTTTGTMITNGFLSHNCHDFHKSGFTSPSLCAFLVKYGFDIKNIKTEDRQIFVEAIKNDKEFDG